MDRKILIEKQRNSELENRIKQLEAQANEAKVPSVVPPVPSNPEHSKLENLLEKAMDRMTTIEEQLKQQIAAVTTPEPLSHERKVKESEKHAASSPADGDDDFLAGDQMEATDDSDADHDDVDNYITTPDGQRVPLL
jgi:DNA repair exonuclease SbcCD ATPase subunit